MIGLDPDGRAIVERVVAAQRRSGLAVLASNDSRDFLAPDQTVELGGRESEIGNRKPE
jgi:hypothetical protein